jgi:putative mRNA 3-end processing factor
MLVGGAAIFYNSEVAKNTRNAISLVSYQAQGTPGRTLLDRGLALVNGKPKKVTAEIRRFDFSSHSGRKELFEMFKHIKGNPKVLAIHGEEESCLKFAQEIREKFGFDTFAPTAGEKFVV